MAVDTVVEAGEIRRRSVLIAVGVLLLLLPVALTLTTERAAQATLVVAWFVLLALFLLALVQRISLTGLERGALGVGTVALTVIFWAELGPARSVDEIVKTATIFGPPNALMAGAGAFLVLGPRRGLWYSAALSLTWMVLVAIRAAGIAELGNLFGEVDHLVDAMMAYLVTIALMWALTRQNLTWSVGEAAARNRAEHDALTGLANRRLFERQLAAFLNAPVNEVVVGLVDIDHFKVVNDTHGHAVGDVALRAVAHTLRDEVRDGDLVARWGGEEFVVIFTGSPPDLAVVAAERCRAAVEAARPRRAEDEWFPEVTASFGLAHARASESASELLHRADQQLYRAKETGRNRVCMEGIN